MSLDDDLSPPPQKRRKLSSICGNNLLSNLSTDNNSQLDDVTFILGPGKQRIPGNRTIFGLQSQVFRAMLFGNMMESKSDEITIDDITGAAFTFLKNLFYGNETALNTDIVCDVLYACKKYLLIDLECECYKFIENVNNLDDWWQLVQLQTALTAGDIDMTDALIRKSKVLIKNSESIATSEDKLINIVPEWLAKIVLSSSFVIEKEETVWEMCVKYCEKRFTTKTLQKNGMNDYFVGEIRFPLISKKYLVNNIETSGMLSFEILYEISKCLDKTDNEYKYNSKYKWKWYPRKPYYQNFLACYDIKSLKNGDIIGLHRKNGKYLKSTINNIEFTENSTKSKFSSGIKFADQKKCCFKDKGVEHVRRWWYLVNGDGLPMNQSAERDVKTYLGKVQVKTAQWDKHWVIGTNDSHIESYKVVKTDQPFSSAKINNFYVHPWNFTCIRPLQD